MNSPIDRPFSRDRDSLLGSAGGPRFEDLERDAARDREERRRLLVFIAVAAVLHVALLLVALPEFRRSEYRRPSAGSAFVLQTARFRPPPVQSQRSRPVEAKRKRKRIPMPDPTPDDPEPFFEELEIEIPVFDFGDEDFPIAIPAAPGNGRGRGSGSGSGSGSGRFGGDGVLSVGGSVSAPRKIFGPQPAYTEEARTERVEGIMVLEAIIDSDGNVADVRVLKGLPAGLDASALETLRTWRFEPGEQDGRPVAVRFTVTVRFALH